MQTELPSDHDERELDRLLRFLTRPGRPFGLAIATYEDPNVALELRQRAISRAVDLNVGTVSLTDAGDDLVALLASETRRHDALFVVGLDGIITDLGGQRADTRAIINLNLRRDELPQWLLARVVLWMSHDAYAQLAALAWDLVEVALTHFDFTRVGEALDEPDEGDVGWPGWMAPPVHADLEILTRQADSLEQSAASPDARLLTIADAAASAGRIYAQLGRYRDSARMLERAASTYERAANERDASLLVAAAGQRRSLAWAALAADDRELVRAQLARASELGERALALADDATRSAAESGLRIASLDNARLHARLGPRGAELPDAELWTRWRDGDREAGSRLLARHFNPLRVYFLSRAPEADIEDLIQTTFMNMLQSMERDRDVTNPKALLFGIARNVLAHYFRTPYRAQIETLSDSGFDWIASMDSPGERLFAAEKLQLLSDALRSLPVNMQELVELRYLHELTLPELAELLSVPEAIVRGQLHRARRRLQQRYAELASAQPDPATDQDVFVQLTHLRDLARST